jgi:hypothetical protein
MLGSLIKRVFCVLLVACAAYLGLLLYPDPLFAYEARVQNVVLHARTPLPPEADAVAARAAERVARSPFFDAADTYHVYLCDTAALFRFFSLLDPDVGAVSQMYFVGNVFIRPSRIERDRLLGPRGGEVPNERTLTYFIAHELTHSMLARRIGRLAYARLAVWQQEGYADYVGKAGDFDFAEVLAGFRAGSRELDPALSGLYLRYHLLVAYALEQQGISPRLLLSGYVASAPLEAQLARPLDPSP